MKIVTSAQMRHLEEEAGQLGLPSPALMENAGRGLASGVEVRELDTGLVIVAGAGLVNLALGGFLMRTGRRHASLTLVADGQHVLSDFWTSAGIVVGLALVRVTGRVWLDPLVAAVVALNLLWTGFRLVRHAAGGLLDEEDTALLHRLTRVLGSYVGQGVIRVHHLRAMRAGRFHHVDAHLVVPEFWTVERAHQLAEDLEARVIRDVGVHGEIAFHTDPCQRAYCAMCDLEGCPVRRDAFRGRPGPRDGRVWSARLDR